MSAARLLHVPCALALAVPGSGWAGVIPVPSPAAPDLARAIAVAGPGDEIRVSPRHVPSQERVRVDRSVTIVGNGGIARLPPLEVVDGAVLALTDVHLALSHPAAGHRGPDGSEDDEACTAAVCVEEATLTATRIAVVGGIGIQEGTLSVEEGTWTGPGLGIHAISSAIVLVRPAFTGLIGGGIRGEDADVVLVGGAFSGNGGPAPGVDVALVGGALSVEGTRFSGGADGAIHVRDAPVSLLDVTFDGYAADRGAALFVEAVAPRPVIVDGVVATDLWADDAGGFAWLEGVDAVLAGVEATGIGAGDRGGVLAVTGGRVEWVASSLASVGASEGDGAVVWASGAELILDGLEVVGGGLLQAGRGGVVAAEDADVTVVGGSATAVVAGAGGYAWGTGRLTVEALSLIDVVAMTGGGGFAWRDGAVDLSGVEALRPGAWVGALAVLADVGTLRVQDARVIGAAAPGGGVVRVVGAVDGVVRNSRFCGGVTGGSGSGLVLDGFDAGVLRVENNVFLANASPGAGPVAGVGVGTGRLVLHNNVVAGNSAPDGAIRLGGISFDLVNNVIIGSEVGLAAFAPGLGATGGYNLWDDDAVVAAAGFPTGSALRGPPGFVDDPLDRCDALVYLRPDSLLRDAGDPALVDPDGSRSDVGAYGGPGARIPDADGDGIGADLDCDDTRADRWPGAREIPYDGVDQDCDGEDLCDVDGDGVLAVECGGDDCGDRDPATRPGAPDVPYDGVDQDCDGEDLTDADGDGWAAVVAGGADCDDGDATVHPGAVEVAGDGVDQDCDGGDRRTFLTGGGGCGTLPGPTRIGWGLVVVALGIRRRSGVG